MLVCAFLYAFCTRDRGCSAHPAFPAPSDWRGRNIDGKPRAKHAARSRSRVCETDRRLRRPAKRGRDGLLTVYRESSRIIEAPFSAIIAVGVLVLPEVIVGITEASATRSPATPGRRS